MPGAGSRVAANHLFKVAQPDGLTFGVFNEVQAEGWAPSAGIAAGSWAFVYGLFDRLLHVPLPAGPLLQLAGLG